MVERKLLRRVAAILFHRRAGFSANGMGVWKVPEDEIMDGRWPHGFLPRHLPTPATSATYADWPYSVFTMAHGRSKEECDAILDSIALECGMGPDDRATLYSSTEYKKIRLHYFTDDYRRWEESIPSGERSAELYRRALQVLPGGVNSPVRAMRQIGREPIFVERGEGCELIDVDGNRYVDWVGSWGPLILGHAHPAAIAAAAEAATRGRASAPRPRRHRPRGRGQVRRRLPRPLRRPARRGRLRDRDPGTAGDAGGHEGADRRHGALVPWNDQAALDRARRAPRRGRDPLKLIAANMGVVLLLDGFLDTPPRPPAPAERC